MIQNDPDRLIKKEPFGQTITHCFQRTFEDNTYILRQKQKIMKKS